MVQNLVLFDKIYNVSDRGKKEDIYLRYLKYLKESEVKNMPEEFMKTDFAVDVKAVEGERVLNWTITTTKRDRAGDIVEAKGAKLTNFRKNPVVLLAHDYKGLSIAKAEKLEKTDDKIMAKVVFPPEGDYPLADTVYKLYKGKFMRACSIGFIPIKSEDIVDEEDDKDKDKESCFFVLNPC